MADTEVIIAATLDVEGTPWRVLRWDLVEALSQVSYLDCEAMEHDAEPRAPAELVGKTAKFELERTDQSQKRSFSGRVVRAERRPDRDGVRTLHLRVAPAPWTLTKRADCRVFQKLTVPDIVKKVLTTAGVGADRQKWQLVGEHPVREYVVQYRETDLQFVLRLLAEEGIYFVARVDGVDQIVFGDDPAGLGVVEGTSNLPFRPASGVHESADVIMRCRQTLTVTTDKVTLRDYNPAKPKLKLEASVTGDGEGTLEVYDYPGRFADPGDGKRLAQILLDELQDRRDTVQLETGSIVLLPGLRFTIEQHPYASLNREHIVVATRLVGGSPRLGAAAGGRADEVEHRVEVTAIPATTHCVPPVRPSAVRMPGLQTTFITGAGGEEIHVNDHGQVKIWHHWDRLQAKDDASSLWVRTSQLPTGGSMLLPRVGWEATTSYEEGDPDRPLVMGRLYNGTAPPPYSLPGEAARSSLQTATSPGGGSVNELRTTDTKGSEEMFFNASKDMAVDVKNNTTESVGANCTREIGSNQKKNVTNSVTATVGGSQTMSVGGNQTVHVESKFVD
jgi:type VI secretion system secreted protein VgrG